ncbi:unnamed protein product [Moneuplotes crassus]|uniref:Jacalin-type lectin domain-containing protein n=1 Tax=Euplotes crassus TaxID=5936 RepID=A0AAD1UKB1_EUPCR|nr:unnamed protein product [Moneuplotes crassus]
MGTGASYTEAGKSYSDTVFYSDQDSLRAKGVPPTKITAIKVWSQKKIFAIEVFYDGESSGQRYGSEYTSDCKCDEFKLKEKEDIKSISGKVGEDINYFRITTTKARSRLYGRGGAGSQFSLTDVKGKVVKGFKFGFGKSMTSVGVWFADKDYACEVPTLPIPKPIPVASTGLPTPTQAIIPPTQPPAPIPAPSPSGIPAPAPASIGGTYPSAHAIRDPAPASTGMTPFGGASTATSLPTPDPAPVHVPSIAPGTSYVPAPAPEVTPPAGNPMTCGYSLIPGAPSAAKVPTPAPAPAPVQVPAPAPVLIPAPIPVVTPLTKTIVGGKIHTDTEVFDDYKSHQDTFDKNPSIRISELRVIHNNDIVFGVEAMYSIGTMQISGGMHVGKECDTTCLNQAITLEPGETIVAVTGKNGEVIDSLSIVTSKGTTYNFGGSGGDYFYSLAIPEGKHLKAIAGGIGGHLHNICGYYE